jgi:hypothetical protein
MRLVGPKFNVEVLTLEPTVLAEKEKKNKPRHIISSIAAANVNGFVIPRSCLRSSFPKACNHSQGQSDHANDCQRLHDPVQAIVDIRHIDVATSHQQIPIDVD